MELGFRYEWNGTPAEGGHRFIIFNPATSALQQVNQPYKQNINYKPRLGFVYDPSGKGTMVIREEYGILVDQPIISAVQGLTLNPPLSNPLTLTATSSTTQVPIGSAFATANLSGLAPSFSCGLFKKR